MTLAWMFTFGRMADVKELSQSLHFDLFCHCVTNLNTGLRPPSAYSAVVRLLTIAAFLVYPALGRVGYCFGAMCVFTRKCNNWKSTDQKAVTAPAAIGLKSGQAPASTPKMLLSPHCETDRSRIWVNRVRFSNFDRLCSQSVNNVCKLLQLLDDFAIPIGALPVDPMGTSVIWYECVLWCPLIVIIFGWYFMLSFELGRKLSITWQLLIRFWWSCRR